MYWKGEAELLEDWAYDYGCSSGTPLRDAVGSFKKKNSSTYGTVYYLNWDYPVPTLLYFTTSSSTMYVQIIDTILFCTSSQVS